MHFHTVVENDNAINTAESGQKRNHWKASIVVGSVIVFETGFEFDGPGDAMSQAENRFAYILTLLVHERQKNMSTVESIAKSIKESDSK
jgi:hypothetical protein